MEGRFVVHRLQERPGEAGLERVPITEFATL